MIVTLSQHSCSMNYTTENLQYVEVFSGKILFMIPVNLSLFANFFSLLYIFLKLYFFATLPISEAAFILVQRKYIQMTRSFDSLNRNSLH